MSKRLGWLWIAAGCGGGVHSSPDAPFEIGGIKSGLWSVSANNDAQYQSGILLLSDEKIDCSTIAGNPPFEAIDELTRGGKGLLFLFDQNVADGGAVLEWTGTWTSYGDLPGSGEWGSRFLTATAFETGVIYEMASEPSDWVRLDEVGDKVEGEFWTEWWRGTFDAEACGAYEDVVDTGITTTL